MDNISKKSEIYMDNISIGIGDKVIIHKPSDLREYPTWGPAMDMYDGQVASVKYVDKIDNTVTMDDDAPFYFNINWLELVTTDDDFDTEVGSLYEQDI